MLGALCTACTTWPTDAAPPAGKEAASQQHGTQLICQQTIRVGTARTRDLVSRGACSADDEITRLRSPAVLSDSSNPGPLRQFIHPSDAPVPSETSILAAIAASMPARISSNPSSEDSRCDSFRLRITEVSIPAALEKSYTTKRGTTLTVPLKAARSFCLTECAAAKNKKPLRGKMTAAAPVQL